MQQHDKSSKECEWMELACDVCFWIHLVAFLVPENSDSGPRSGYPVADHGGACLGI